MMRTLVSIPLILLILFSGISVKFATHYCGGYVAATKVSLTGELATCGMEQTSHNNSSQENYRHKCCEDVTSSYSICNNYLSSSYSVNDPGQPVIHTFFVPADILINQVSAINTSFISTKPPGTYSPNSVERPALCIFRI
jgi:hypothetical protein